MNIWSGNIELPDPSPVESLDVHISFPSAPAASVLTHIRTSLTAATLTFVSYIDPTRVPLFLACGPSLSVTTASLETERFFHALFLSTLPPAASFKSSTPDQCRVALLVRATPGPTQCLQGWSVTELVVYGAISALTPSTDRPATPPNSSPPPLFSTEIPSACVSVHALPLSSQHDYRSFLPVAKAEPAPVRLSACTSTATFVAPDPQGALNPFIPHSAKKRRADALDAAAEKRKKPRKQPAPPVMPTLGPLGVSAKKALDQVLARPDLRTGTESAVSICSKVEKKDLEDTTAILPNSSTQSSMVSGPKLVPRGRSVSVLPSLGYLRSKTSKPEPFTLESRNRDAINKVVISSMRQCGLRDYRTERAKSIKSEAADDSAMVVYDETKEAERDEYKLIFYHTVVAAEFALRRKVDQEFDIDRVQSVVEGLLRLFGYHKEQSWRDNLVQESEIVPPDVRAEITCEIDKEG